VFATPSPGNSAKKQDRTIGKHRITGRKVCISRFVCYKLHPGELPRPFHIVNDDCEHIHQQPLPAGVQGAGAEGGAAAAGAQATVPKRALAEECKDKFHRSLCPISGDEAGLVPLDEHHLASGQYVVQRLLEECKWTVHCFQLRANAEPPMFRGGFDPACHRLCCELFLSIELLDLVELDVVGAFLERMEMDSYPPLRRVGDAVAAPMVEILGLLLQRCDLESWDIFADAHNVLARDGAVVLLIDDASPEDSAAVEAGTPSSPPALRSTAVDKSAPSAQMKVRSALGGSAGLPLMTAGSNGDEESASKLTPLSAPVLSGDVLASVGIPPDQPVGSALRNSIPCAAAASLYLEVANIPRADEEAVAQELRTNRQFAEWLFRSCLKVAAPPRFVFAAEPLYRRVPLDVTIPAGVNPSLEDLSLITFLRPSRNLDAGEPFTLMKPIRKWLSFLRANLWEKPAKRFMIGICTKESYRRVQLASIFRKKEQEREGHGKIWAQRVEHVLRDKRVLEALEIVAEDGDLFVPPHSAHQYFIFFSWASLDSHAAGVKALKRMFNDQPGLSFGGFHFETAHDTIHIPGGMAAEQRE
jgi:hypothetical protein